MDWKKLMTEILDRPISQSAVGDRLGKSQAWVSAVLNGDYKDLKWTDGEALRKLHGELCQAQPTKKAA